MEVTDEPQKERRDRNDEESGMPARVTQEYITLRQMQEILQIGPTKAYEIANSGELPGVVRIGRIIRINRRSLSNWLQEQSIAANRK